MNTITIKSPTFYSQEDEEIFFQCIYNLPEYKEVIGVGAHLKIVFNSATSSEAKNHLDAICIRWKIDAYND